MSETAQHHLYRSRSDKMLGGVSGGLADYFDVDPVLVRLAWVALTALSGGLFALAYLVLWVIVPLEGKDYVGRETMRENLNEVADEARTFAGEVREAFRPTDTPDPDPPPSPSVAPTAARRRHQNGHIWGGLILVMLGLVFLTENLGILPRFNWALLWPGLLIVIGLALLAQRSRA